MDRHMSYELDGAFMGRNAGELQNVEVAKTRVTRAPGLQYVHNGHGGHRGRNLGRPLDPPMSDTLHARQPTALFPSRTRRIPGPQTDSLAIPISNAPRDLAEYDMGEITLPLIGTLNVTNLLIGAVLGMIAMKTIGHMAKRRA